MEKLLRTALATLGCDDKETRLFLAAFSHGPSALPELAKAARLQRSTAYVIVKSLLERGLMAEDHKAYGKRFSALDPAALVALVANKQRQIGRQKLNLEEHLGELQALYAASDSQPRVRTYQGPNGLVSVWRDILTAQTEILIWTNQATESRLFSTVQHSQFIEQRRSGGHYARVLTLDNPPGQALLADDSEALRETRLLPSGIEFSAETYVYDNKVAVLDYDQDIIGIITESRAVATSQRAMFETAWASCA